MVTLPQKYAGATILEESTNLVLIETADGNSFWIRKNDNEFPAASKPEPGAPRRYRGPGKKPKKLGFRDSDGTIYRTAEGQERLQLAFAARPRSF